MKDIVSAEEIKRRFNLDLRHSRTLGSIMKAILDGQTVKLSKISQYVKEDIREESVYRKLQRFIGKVELNEDVCADMIMKTLGIPENEEVILILDRTYWMHGNKHLNFLYLSVYYRGYAIPIYFKIMPDMKGHSSVEDRRELLEKFIQQFGKEKIAYIVADREFDGGEWLGYLDGLGIYYVQRLKEKNICMTNARGEYVPAASLCHHLKPLEKECFGKRRIYKSRGFTTYITAAKNAKNKVLLLAHSPQIKDPTKAYGTRWSIECGFRAMKSGGFNMHETGVTATNKLTTLFRIIAILTAITHKMGILIDEIQPIKLKSHKRKAISYIQLAIILIFRILNTSFKFPLSLRPIIPKLKLFPLNFFEFCRVRYFYSICSSTSKYKHCTTTHFSH